MFKIVRGAPFPPILDLSSRRAALSEFRDDVARVPGLDQLAAALDRALVELDASERRAQMSGQRAIDYRRLLPNN